MPRSRDPKSTRLSLAALTVALLVHAALLMLPLPGPVLDRSVERPAPLAVEILARVAEEAPLLTEPSTTVPTPTERRPTEPRDPSANGHEEEPEPSRPEATPPRKTAADASSARQLRTRLLEEAGELGRSLEAEENAPVMPYDPVPELPGRPGWLNQHVGGVSPSVDRWQAGDGAQNTRFVTGSGQIVCVRTRAPTIDEVFNPWQSSAVGMMRDCGRERPAPDPSDPWTRRPAPNAEKR